MFKFVFLCFLAGLLCLKPATAGNDPAFVFYGYLSHQVIYDSYRSLDSRDGEIYFYPLRANIDENGKDLNRKPRFNMVEVQSRFGVRMAEREVFGASLTGLLEADFLGIHQDYTRMLRLRQAYVALNWERHMLLFGNTFHPAFVLECFPTTVSFASGVPFNPLNRSPQVRYAFSPVPEWSISFSMLTHGYHRSAGPSDAQRNSGLPDMQFRLQYGDGILQAMGIVAGYKFLTPRDETASGISTRETIGSFNLQAFLKHTFPGFSVKAQGVYGQNLSSLVMIGGYGIKGRPGEVDLMGDYSYTNIRTISAWTDLETRGEPFRAGLFAGYTANLGADHDYISLPGYARNDDLHYVYRFSPRLMYMAGNLEFAFEWSVVGAAYGLDWDHRHRVTQTDEPTVNNHIIFATKYYF